MTRDIPRLSRKRLRDCKGNTLVEAAILTPLLLLLTFSIMDFASLFYVYLALENGVSQASRYGVTGQQMDDPAHPGSKLSHSRLDDRRHEGGHTDAEHPQHRDSRSAICPSAEQSSSPGAAGRARSRR